MQEFLCYDDVLLLPQYSDIRSRAEISLETDLTNNLILPVPIIGSPMDTVSEAPMAIALGIHGGTAIIHRYNTIEIQSRMVSLAHDVAKPLTGTGSIIVGAAIGVTGDYMARALSLVEANATFLCVDVAHGHHINMREALKNLRSEFGDDLHIMAGNVATLKGFNDLADWGANSIRVGIGGGSICSTRIQTGHGMPTLQSVIDCSVSDRDAFLIADGGLKNSGDIVKSLAAGADFVILGSLLASAEEAPGEIHLDADGSTWKSYRGMASKEAQVSWRGRVASEEGVASRVPVKGPVENILKSLEKGIRSGLSYSGCKSLLEFSSLSTFVEQTHAGRIESSTHIQTR